MPEVVAAPEAFASVRRAICGPSPRISIETPWLEGTPPARLMGELANDNLIPLPSLDVGLIEQAIEFVPAESLNEYRTWHDFILAFAGEIARRPEAENVLRSLAHRLSRRASIYGQWNGEAYPQAENDLLLDQAIAAANRKMASGEEIRTIASLFKTARDNGWNPAVAVHPQTPAALPSLPGAMFGSFAVQPLFKRRPIFGAYLYLGEITLLSGPGGVSKSTFASAIAMSVASGMPLLGIKTVQRQVLFINLEDSAGEVHLKLAAVARHAQLPISVVANHIRIIGAEDAHRFILTEADERGKLRLRDAGFEQLRHVIEHDRPELVVIDPIVLLMAEGQNDNGTMAQVQRRLKQMAVELDFALLQVAHTRKGSNAA